MRKAVTILALVGCTVLLALNCFGQNANINSNFLIGNWKLNSHTYVEGKKKVNCDTTLYSPTYSIQKNGAYNIYLKGKLVQKGNWKLHAGHFTNRAPTSSLL